MAGAARGGGRGQGEAGAGLAPKGLEHASRRCGGNSTPSHTSPGSAEFSGATLGGVHRCSWWSPVSAARLGGRATLAGAHGAGCLSAALGGTHVPVSPVPA